MYRQSPTVSHLILSVASGAISAHDKATGRLAWEASVNDRPFDTRVRLVVDGERVVGFGRQIQVAAGIFDVSSSHHVLFQLDYTTGRVIWSVELPGPVHVSTLLVDAPHVFLTDRAVLSAFAFEDGRLLWQKKLGEDFQPFPVGLATHAGSGLGDGN